MRRALEKVQEVFAFEDPSALPIVKRMQLLNVVCFLGRFVRKGRDDRANFRGSSACISTPELSRRSCNGAQHARACLEHAEAVLGRAVIRIDLGEDRRLEGSSLLCVARRAAISSIEAVEFSLHGTRRRDVSPRLYRGHVSASSKDGVFGENGASYQGLVICTA